MSYTKKTERRGRDGRRQPNMWPDPATKMLIKLKRAGLTRSQISRALKDAGHGTYSPEAVCGKVFRLREAGVCFKVCDYSPMIPTVSTGVVLGTFLERLCDVGSW